MAPHFHFPAFCLPVRKTIVPDGSHNYHGYLPWISSPVDESVEIPRLYQKSDSTPIELFFDLFFVANLSTFTATHEINNIHAPVALGSYVGFLGVIWFTWFQVTMFDIRFARDSVFERICKAMQLGAMVGFASAGTRFTTRVQDENVWAFQSLTAILAGSRLLLATQYSINVAFMRSSMKRSSIGVAFTASVLYFTGSVYGWMYLAFSPSNRLRGQVWTIWFVIFALEMWAVMLLSCLYPRIGFQDTHLNVRMGLLTLIIIGEGVIAITRIANKTVRPGGWTKWSFVHILGVTTNVYLLWQVYFDMTPRDRLGKLAQQIWAQLHFPFHVALILLLEGSQILALSLDVTLKLNYLKQTLSFICEDPIPTQSRGVALIRSTITDMEIPFSRGATQEWIAISTILDDLTYQPLCPESETFSWIHTEDLFNDLLGNVTAALFSSMDIIPSNKVDYNLLDNQELLQIYMKLLAFVYVYFFVVASISMGLFSAFLILSHRHTLRLHLTLSTSVRILLAICLASLVAFASHFPLAYAFMTSPIILYAFTLTLLTVLLVDRLLDFLASQGEAPGRQKQKGDVRPVSLSIMAMGPPPMERSDLRVTSSTVRQEEETAMDEISGFGSTERR